MWQRVFEKLHWGHGQLSTRLPAVLVVALAASGFAVSATLQTPVTCLSLPNLTMTGCTAFGLTSDLQVRSHAEDLLDLMGYQQNSFCEHVFAGAETFLSLSTLDGVFESAELDGEDKNALAVLDTETNEMTGGWVGPFIRNGNETIGDRGAFLMWRAIHEGGHQACREGDFGVQCDWQDDDEIDRTVEEECFEVS